jgi:hypothetical protein
MTALRGLTLLALLALFAGCSELPKPDPLKSGPFFTPANVKATGPLPAEVKRVVVLPCWGGPTLTEETLGRIDEAAQTEVTKTNRFETVAVSRDALYRLAGKRALSSVDNLPAHLLEKLLKDYGADAVLFTDVTSFSAYPPLTLGLRVKLARLSNGDILWAADNVFSAAEAAVANSARKFAREMGTDRGPTDLSHTILQNPSRFAAYASAATFATLPPR